MTLTEYIDDSFRLVFMRDGKAFFTNHVQDLRIPSWHLNLYGAEPPDRYAEYAGSKDHWRVLTYFIEKTIINNVSMSVQEINAKGKELVSIYNDASGFESFNAGMNMSEFCRLVERSDGTVYAETNSVVALYVPKQQYVRIPADEYIWLRAVARLAIKQNTDASQERRTTLRTAAALAARFVLGSYKSGLQSFWGK